MKKTSFLSIFLFCLIFNNQIILSQDYNPKRFFNPLNSIDTKQKSKAKTFVEFIQFNRKKKKKEKCDCPDDNKIINYQTNKFSITSTFNNF